MRFLKISFKNYRCFLNETVDFIEKKDRNINLFVGPNGGGKTELLFAFWWVLYNFDFSKLTGKEDTPYALNSDLYKKLQQNDLGAEEKCQVSLDIENEGIKYHLTKEAAFRKTPQRIKIDEWQILSRTFENGETSTPIYDVNEIERIVEKIIPKNVLYGILFDGERMQKLSSPNEIAKTAIKGVISDITNVNLVEKSIESFRSISNQLSKESKSLANKIGDTTIETIISEIEELENEEKSILEKLSSFSDTFDKNMARISQISEELQKINEIKALEKERNSEREKIEKSENLLEQLYKNFSADLNEGYLNITDKLFTDVEKLIQRFDIPEGLTVEAVSSILLGHNCICGRPLGEQERAILNELLTQLPPDNISSTLAEAVRQVRSNKEVTMKRIKTTYDIIIQEENNIQESKKKIVELSSKIETFDNKAAKELEKENSCLREEIGVIKTEKPRLERRLKECQAALIDKRNIRENLGKNKHELSKYTNQLSFIDKCLQALNCIKQENKTKALKEINNKLNNAYKCLSEDSSLGKEIYIIQFDSSRQFQMVIYLKNNYESLYAEWCKNGTFNALKADGLSEDEIKEKIIIECIDSSSTGQSKMNTLSFIKAILDYSNQQKEEESFEIQKNYPLLIDAPFSDIAGSNLVNSASELHSFAEQIILMLDSDKYKNIKDYIDPYLSQKYEFTKIENENHTVINKVEN